MDVQTLLGQLQQALTEKAKPVTCEVATQTFESFQDPDHSMLESLVDLWYGEVKVAHKERFHWYLYPETPANPGKKRRLSPVKTPKPLTLEQPPSNPSVKTFETNDALINFEDNISEQFDENDRSPDVEDEVICDTFDAYCPKCKETAEGYTNVREVFGTLVKDGKETAQSWCIKCRSGYAKRSGRKSPLDKVFDPTSTIINRKGAIFCATTHGSHGMEFHDTIRKASETWSQAEERHRAKSHPIVQKRAKMLGILAKQNQTSMHKVMEQYAGKTTLELFCLIKNESPELLKPLGLPEQE